MTERAHIIVVGNEKGGTGKSTTAMHLIVGLLRRGLSVGSVDLDARQGTLTRYVENRRQYIAGKAPGLPVPVHQAIHATDSLTLDEARLREAMDRLTRACHVVIVDTPVFAIPPPSPSAAVAELADRRLRRSASVPVLLIPPPLPAWSDWPEVLASFPSISLSSRRVRLDRM